MPRRLAFLLLSCGRAPDGRGRGRQTWGPLWLSVVTGNGAPRTRGGETGRSGSVGLFLFAGKQVFSSLIKGKAEISPLGPPRSFLEL